MTPRTPLLLDCRKLDRLSACRLAKRLRQAHGDMYLVALVSEAELSLGWALGFDAVVTTASAFERLEPTP